MMPPASGPWRSRCPLALPVTENLVQRRGGRLRGKSAGHAWCPCRRGPATIRYKYFQHRYLQTSPEAVLMEYW